MQVKNNRDESEEIMLSRTQREEKLRQIKKEWSKFISGDVIDTNVINPVVCKSWERSKKYGVDPYKSMKTNILSDDDMIMQLTDCSELKEEYGQIIDFIREMAEERGLICRICDKETRVRKIIAKPDVIQANIKKGNYFALYATEEFLGTNALSLAISENKPVQIVGPEHYNYYFHTISCSAAPLHNEKGEVTGVLNISTNNILDATVQTLGFAASIAKMLDNQIYIQSMLNNVSIQNEILTDMMERLPSGLVYLDEEDQVKSFNSEILKMLNIDYNKEEEIKRAIANYLNQLNIKNAKNFDNKEVFLKVKSKNISFLVSLIKVGSPDEGQSKIILFDSTKRIMKLQQSLQSNSSAYYLTDIIGEDPALHKVKSLAQTVAPSGSSIVIHGESGTGKEVFAQAIHNASDRSGGPFVGINCSAIPTELVESELFGYEAGAFTGASQRGKPGKLEIASGGTLFLDEIESIPLSIQTKLLRALSANKIVRLGGNKEISINIRLISSTKKDLSKEISEGNFRDDFYYRINIITINIPPLRERKNDIPLLIQHFLKKPIEIDQEFITALMAYSWPGNVRELSNVIERAEVLSFNDTSLNLSHLPDHIRDSFVNDAFEKELNNKLDYSSKKEQSNLLLVAEECAILMALKKSNCNLSKVAEELNIARSTLYGKIKKSPRISKELHLLRELNH